MRTLFYDIEAGQLDPQRGRLYVFGYKWMGEKKVHTPSIIDDNPPCECCGLMKLDDRGLVKVAHKILSQADVVVTFNGRLFDEPFLRSKFMRGNLPVLGFSRHVDLYQIARHKMRLAPKSLANISHYLQLKHQKTKLDWDIWTQAGDGQSKAMRYIQAHAAADVLVTEELYQRFLPYIPQHPFMFEDRAVCSRCGSKMMRDKVISTLASPKVQYVCRNGHYETRAA